MADSSSVSLSSDPTLAHQLSGHLGNLNPIQEQALTTFKDNLTKANLYVPAVEGPEAVKASHDDATLLRFLRARSFNPSAAQKQFADAENWRKKHNVTEIYKEIGAEDLDLSRRFYPRWTGRRDKLGLPLYVYRLASLEPFQQELDALPAKTRYERIIILYEFMTRFTFPLCTHLPRATAPIPVSSTTTIIDLDNVSFGSMWRLRTHLQEASRLSTSNYPETLHHIAIVNSPSFFPTIWNWIKGWFDEGTRKKIHVLGRDPGSTLRELVHSHDLPAVYGGELEWKYEDEPLLDEHAKQAIEEFPRGPVIFVDGKVAPPS
ncbi:Sec14 cytosolic factor [Psilocybe cubensis]|uniref:Sec14 cytosolic factor n=2 Tax=Psilocybe cubensis TaxID=181762 RepID=A0ACB8GX62_PSICU|nr:Sec14 cytosolic factor [Psilocybe cubensis]KAH9480189.1 Sec14 cytosolic factor [Psilocybe cubensis]